MPILLIFLNLILFSRVSASIYNLTNHAKDFLLFTSSLAIVMSCLFDNSHSNRCMVVSHCFDLYFLMINDVEDILMDLSDIYMSCLEKFLFRPLAYFLIRFFFFFLLLCEFFIYFGYYPLIINMMGFPDATSGKEPASQCRTQKRHRFYP